MKSFVIFKQSLKAIVANKGRSFLTTLGIIIGIGSVIALMALGAGVKESISSRIATLGTRNLIIMPGEGIAERASSAHAGGGNIGGQQSGGSGGMGGAGSTLTLDDLNTLRDKKKNSHVKLAAGNVSGSAIFTTDSGEKRFSVTGTELDYFKIQGYKIDKGEQITAADVTNRARVIVMGNQSAKDIYGGKTAVEQELTIEGSMYKVIGVLKKVDETGLSNPNSQIFIPYTSAFDSFKVEKFNVLTALADNEANVAVAKKTIKRTIMDNHSIKEEKLADFNVNSSADLLSTISTITGIMTSLLAGIAAISLIVGGIGIMNIMLVSVTERTREIGLRKAVGAKTGDILGQFVVEAILLTLTGGLLGIAAGYGMAEVASRMLGFAPVITLDAIVLAVGVSTGVGLLFGIYPAAKAARLDPIEALRYE
ncbi:MAG: ABC transporter permease [Actinomycetota bacterium]